MPQKKINQTNNSNQFSAIGLAWELTGIIVIPLIICLLAGSYLDQFFQTRPLFIIIGLMLSFAFTSYAMLVKITRLNQDFNDLSGPIIRKPKTRKKSRRKIASKPERLSKK